MDWRANGFKRVGSLWRKGELSLQEIDKVLRLTVEQQGRILGYFIPVDQAQKLEWGSQTKHLIAYSLAEVEAQPIHRLELADGDYILGTKPGEEDGYPLWRFSYRNGAIECNRLANGKLTPFRGPIQFILRSNDSSTYMIVPCDEVSERSLFSALMDLIA